MADRRRQLGDRGEALACNWLQKQGYRILTQNYRTPMGEIDIVARDCDTIAFIEVKSRRSRRHGDPKWAITPRKQRHISLAAMAYLKQTRRTGSRARFDVVTVNFATTPPDVQIIKNAFDVAPC